MNHSGLVFLGPPGAGKGTQSEILAEKFNIPHISTGDILRSAIANQTPLGKKAQSYVDQGDLVPDDLILDLIRDRLKQSDAQAGWILDGFPRTVDQASFLDDLLQDIHDNVPCAVNLEVPDQVLIHRLLARGRKDDNQDIITHRLQVYREKTAPVIEYYLQQGTLHSVNGDRTPDEVHQALQSIVETKLQVN